MQLAQALRESIIPNPSVMVDGLAVEFLYEPVTHVGGDVLDILPMEDQGLMMFLFDSMGAPRASTKGWPACRTSTARRKRAICSIAFGWT